VDVALATLMVVRSETNRLTSDLEEDIAAVRERHGGKLETLKQNDAVLLEKIEEFCRARRDDFNGQQSRKLAAGTVGFRLTPPKVVLPDEQLLLAKLRENKLLDCIDERPRPAAEAIKKLGKDILRILGVLVTQEEKFFVKVKD
jgi:phage host-nuclease inhibitor protein Gam